MKYKPGDKVRIKSLDWYNENKNEIGRIYGDSSAVFIRTMSKFCGQTVTISEAAYDIYGCDAYGILEDNNEYSWTDYMIEGLADESKEKKIEGLFECDVIEASELDEHMMRIPTLTTPDDIREHVKDAACKAFQEMLIELCPELLGRAAAAVAWENEFKKRLEARI